MLRRAAHFLLALALLLAVSIPMVWAAREQQGRVRRIKACVGILSTTGEPSIPAAPADPDAVISARSPNPNPYVFYVLNQRKDLLPDGWEYYNPAAPATATLAHQLRWSTIQTAAPSSQQPLAQGQRLTQDKGAYWEMILDDRNYDALSQMDVIYLPIGRADASGNPVATHFTEGQRLLLTKLADAGVTIWVDWALQFPTPNDALGGPTATKNPFFTNLDTRVVGGLANDPLALTPAIKHPLLTAVYSLGPGEPLEIGAGYPPPGGGASNSPSDSRGFETRAADLLTTANFSAVVPRLSSGSPTSVAYVAAARMGAGYVVATAGNVGLAISKRVDWDNDTSSAVRFHSVSPNTNRAFDRIRAAEREDLMFAHNIVAWRSEVTAAQRNVRHMGQSGVQLNGAIEQSNYPYAIPPSSAGGPWRGYPVPGMTATDVNSLINTVPPLLINGGMISVSRYRTSSGSPVISEISFFDTNPQINYDDPNDGFIDDGLFNAARTLQPGDPPGANSDFSLSLPYDKLMSVALPEPAAGVYPRISGVCIGEIPDLATPEGSKALLFANGSAGLAPNTTGLFTLPVPRQGLPVTDFWTAANAKAAVLPSQLQLNFAGAPAFAVLSGPKFLSAPPSGASFFGLPFVYTGGIALNASFGSNRNGRVAAFGVDVSATAAYGTPVANWYYPPVSESNRMGPVSGPITVCQLQDQGTGAIDTMVITTSAASGDATTGQAGANAGDTTGRVMGFVVATRSDPLGFPQGNVSQTANNPAAGRTFVSKRWLDWPPSWGPLPQTPELIWDPSKHCEVRVVHKLTGYVVARFMPPANPMTPLPTDLVLLKNGLAGQVQLPVPPAALAVPGQPGVWNLTDFVLLADYSPIPIPVDNNGATIRPRFEPTTPYDRGGNQNQLQATGIAGGVAVGKDNLVYYGTGIGFMCASEWRKGRPHFRWKVRALLPDYLDQTGKLRTPNELDPGDADYMADHAFVAAPAAGDRVIFASRGRGAGTGTAYMFDPDATIRFKLLSPDPNRPIRWNATKAREVMLQADHGVAVPQNNRGLMADQQPYGRMPNQFVVDPDTSTVTFLNMENFSLDLSKAISPFQAAALGVNTGGRPAVPIQWWLRTAAPPSGTTLEPTVNSPATAYIPVPLVAYYQALADPSVAGQPQGYRAGPVIAGDRVYLMSSTGFLHELPLDPKSVDPGFPRQGMAFNGLTGFNLFSFGLRRVRNVSFAPVPGLAINTVFAAATPAIQENLLATQTFRGVTVFRSPNVVVADTNRVIEASGDSRAAAVTEVLTKLHPDDSDFPVPTDPQFANFGTGRRIVIDRKALNRPSVVRKLNAASSLTSVFASSGAAAASDTAGGSAIRETVEYAEESYLAADTGNNRAVEWNPAGQVIWECTHVQDPFNLLPSGETTALNGPRDVQRWVEQERGTGFTDPVYVIHTLITDTGNNRVLEVVDKVLYQRGLINPNSFTQIPGQVAGGQPIRWYHVVVWSSQTNAQGLNLRYQNAQRIYWADANGDPIPTPGANNGVAATSPPFLPKERYLSYTMATVTGQQLYYPGPSMPTAGMGTPAYNHTWPAPLSQAVLERKPSYKLGGDSIVFLRGLWRIDEGTGGTPAYSGVLREPRPGIPNMAGDAVRFAQGVVDPNVPIINTIHDEMVGAAEASTNPVHTLDGVTSVQRTLRSDVRFAPQDYGAGSGPMLKRMYFLIADKFGVWEFSLLRNTEVPAAGAVPPGYTGMREYRRARLNWAFTVEDYAWVTGAGNGDPTTPAMGPPVYASGNPMDHTPGGRRFSPASARRTASGLVLITSRTPANQVPLLAGATQGFHLHAGADVFLLRATDYRTAQERGLAGQPTAYSRFNLADSTGPLHGWIADIWVQAFPAYPPVMKAAPSIRWRAAEQLQVAGSPTLRVVDPAGSGTNPYELTGSYLPVQPNYADLVY